jgi:hypothetical protein
MNYCNQCKKSLDNTKFDKKKNGKLYTRCKKCRSKHNKQENNKYVKIQCSKKTLCNDNDCKTCFERSFASFNGKTKSKKLKINYWIKDKNNGLIPRNICKNTHTKYWFKCDECDHEFSRYINYITNKTNAWCVYCGKTKLCDDNNCKQCFDKSFASYNGKTLNDKLKIDCMINDKNNGLLAHEIFKSSHKKIWFKCDICNHEFDKKIYGVSRDDSWCPYCVNKCLCKNNCDICYNNSFASYKGKTENGKLKVDCWITEKNNNILPRDIVKGTDKKYWFKCDVCDHEFNMRVCCIARDKNNYWCSFCTNQQLCENDCLTCYNKSFASFNDKTIKGKLKVDCWVSNKNNGLLPRNIFRGTCKKYYFKCDVCDHIFDMRISNITSINNLWCSFCSNSKLCEDDCDICYNKSLASYNGKTINNKLKIDCLIIDKTINIRTIFKFSNRRFWFKCDICNNKFNPQVCYITLLGTWCPICKNKTEMKLNKWLSKNKNIKSVKREYSPKWCSTKFMYINSKKKLIEGRYQYRYDFLITFNNKNNLIIELHGRQHYEQVSIWKTPFEQQIRDKYKEIKARKYNIPLIKCLQEDVYSDKNNWDFKLEKKLKKYY